MSIIVLYIIYISLTIIKCNVLTCYDNNKITGAFRPKVGHCDFAVGALRLGLGHSGRGAFRQWGIATIILSDGLTRVASLGPSVRLNDPMSCTYLIER